MTERVLLIDDDKKLAVMIKEFLYDNGFNVTAAYNGADGIELHQSQKFDAVILDLMLPDTDGLEICRRLRSKSNIPVLMLTAKGDPLDRVIGLELGADDYLPKPFEPRELLARLRAILRRSLNGLPQNDSLLQFGRLEVDREGLEARLDNRRCNLTAYQFQLLEVLALGAGRVLSRDQIMSQLQGEEIDAFDRSIDVHISRIRAEIEDDPKQPRRVITVRGVGYVFAKTQD